MPVFSNLQSGISPEQIRELEALTGLNFPSDYKHHLMKINGGRCEPSDFSFVEDGRTTSSVLDWFLAIYDGKSHNLYRHLLLFKIEEKRMPRHVIPIAHDPGGNLICISCAGHDEGSVYFWDHEREVDYSIADDGDYSNLYFIADSFDAFINGLQEQED